MFPVSGTVPPPLLYLRVAEAGDDAWRELGDHEALGPVRVQRVLQQDQYLLAHLRSEAYITEFT
jgi:hypothetical protein